MVGDCDWRFQGAYKLVASAVERCLPFIGQEANSGYCRAASKVWFTGPLVV